MATLWITEFDRPGKFQGAAPCGQLPAVTHQTISFGAATQSAEFNAATTFIRIKPDADCYILAGINPTATAEHTPIGANATEYFGVTPGHKISVYDGSS